MVALVAGLADVHPLHAVGSRNFFRVSWQGDAFPVAADGCAGGTRCTVEQETCVCDVEEATAAVFNGDAASVRREQLEAKLPIGAPPPDAFGDGAYEPCADAGCAAARQKGVDILVPAGSTVLDERAIFRLSARNGSSPAVRANKVSIVRVGAAMHFRNPPSVMQPLATTARDAAYETDAVIDQLFRHRNLPPFVARALILRLTSSNPSPRYVGSVAAAFRAGTFGAPPLASRFSGRYGDLGATVAAVLLDAEATSATLDADPSSGVLREPILKLTHLMRALEYEAAQLRELDLPSLLQSIGQNAYQSPSVFNFFLPGYSPNGPLAAAGLVSPEAMLGTAPYALGFLNGVGSLIKYGLSGCRGGFGARAAKCGSIEGGGEAHASVHGSARTRLRT